MTRKQILKNEKNVLSLRPLITPLMKKIFILFAATLLLAACTPNPPEKSGMVVNFTETDELFPNPERGMYSGVYYTSGNLNSVLLPAAVKMERNSDDYLTLYQQSYYLTDYIASDIPQAFLNRFEQNMNALREGGAKVVLRFAYKSDNEESDEPWDASPEWVSRHIDQFEPYLKKHADVIFSVQAGFIGVWGEWYYTTHFNMEPQKDSDFEPRWQMLEHLLQAVPEDRQVALRTPAFKMRYLKMKGLGVTPLTETEAYKNTAKARIAGHNDCFVSSEDDYGTYLSDEERQFWQEDTRYTVMGGETCHKCKYSAGPNALLNMEQYHWTYLNRDYNTSVLNAWVASGHMDEVKRRLGYRIALDKAVLTKQPKAGKQFDAVIELHNSGFAAPVNKRDIELVFVSVDNPDKRFVYPQTEDPRFWMPGEQHKFTLSCTLDEQMKGDYYLCLNLPDPYESLHNDPHFSIRLANEAVWDSKTGYNRIAKVTIN